MTGRGEGVLWTMVGTLGLAIALSTTSCAPQEDTYGCKPVDATGGDVLGQWVIKPNVPTSCVAHYERLVSNDWCSQLVWDANGVRQAYLGHPFMTVAVDGMSADGSTTPTSLTFTKAQALEDPTKTEYKYTSELHFGPVPASTTFPKACITAYGQSADDCDVFAGELTTFLGDSNNAWQSFNNTPIALQPMGLPQGLLPQPAFSSVMCTPETSSAGGCTCTYDVTLDVLDHGNWTNAQQPLLTLYSDTAAPPYDLDYASADGALSMSGHAGLDVMGQRGLRKLIWRKP